MKTLFYGIVVTSVIITLVGAAHATYGVIQDVRRFIKQMSED